MLLDKAYYDYDYSEEAIRNSKPKTKPRKKSAEEMSALLARFGFNTKIRTENTEKQKLSAEEMQRIVVEEMKTAKNRENN